MYSRFYAKIGALALIGLTVGCVQATRHSNTMIFGTNTTVGIKVGRDVNQMPSVLIAYDRQEAVIMPLLANTSEKLGSGNLLSPCAPADEITTRSHNSKTGQASETITKMDGDVSFGSDNNASIHPCKFVGVRADKDSLLIQDSYSVLASFGARIEGDAADAKGTVGIAQYFATGVAAQILAATGGAAVVSVGAGAEASAKSTSSSNGAAAVLGAPTFPPGAGKQDQDARTALLAKLATMSDQQTGSALPGFIDSLNISPRQKDRFKTACATKDGCIAFIGQNGELIEGKTAEDVGAI
jgi:hypothetical protein